MCMYVLMLGTVAHKPQKKCPVRIEFMPPRAESAVGTLFIEQLLKDVHSRRTGFHSVLSFPTAACIQGLVGMGVEAGLHLPYLVGPEISIG